MKLFDWLFGKRYLEWDEYIRKIEEQEEKYWEEKSKLSVSK